MFFRLIQLFCFILVWNNNAASKHPDRKFRCIPLGHSGFLITWTPKVGSFNFRLGSRIKEDQSNTSINISVRDIPPPNPTSISFVNPGSDEFGQYKISSLQENTLYEVFIIYEHYPHWRYQVFDCKTNWKTNTKPAKPGFEHKLLKINVDYYSMPKTKITWFPCGRKKNCIGKEAGTHFAVKIRALDRKGECRIEEYKDHEKDIFIVPAIIYEVSVISINGNSETESDPQEIVITPVFSAVRSVKVVSSNVSISMSWEPPTYLGRKLHGYYVAVINHELITNSSIIMLQRFQEEKHGSVYKFKPLSSYETKKIFYEFNYQRKPGDTYIISIIPQGGKVAGIETLVKYTIPDNEDD